MPDGGGYTEIDDAPAGKKSHSARDTRPRGFEDELKRVSGLKDVSPLLLHEGGPRLQLCFQGRDVRHGQNILLKHTNKAPTMYIHGALPDKAYCVLCYDPDAPFVSWPFLSDIPHAFAWNCDTPDASGRIDCATGDTLVSWRPPRPPTGTHRYIFLLCEQSTGVGLPPQVPARFRESVPHYLSKHDLGVISATYFTASRRWCCCGGADTLE